MTSTGSKIRIVPGATENCAPTAKCASCSIRRSWRRTAGAASVRRRLPITAISCRITRLVRGFCRALAGRAATFPPAFRQSFSRLCRHTVCTPADARHRKTRNQTAQSMRTPDQNTYLQGSAYQVRIEPTTSSVSNVQDDLTESTILVTRMEKCKYLNIWENSSRSFIGFYLSKDGRRMTTVLGEIGRAELRSGSAPGIGTRSHSQNWTLIRSKPFELHPKP